MYDNFFLSFGPKLYLGAALATGVLSTVSLTAYYVIASIEELMLTPPVLQGKPLTDEEVMAMVARTSGKKNDSQEKVLM
jgi:hypothetical protein